MFPYVLIAVLTLLALLVLAAFYAFKIQKKHHRKPDYYTFFIMGVIWLGAGIPLKMLPLSAMGVLFMIIGAAHQKDWKKNHLKWEDLSKEEQRFKLYAIGLLLLILVAGVLAFYLTAGGLKK